MAYNRDLQEDKERLFDSVDTSRATLRLTAAMLNSVTVKRDACAAAAGDPALLATDLAEYLVVRGTPFREAHHAVGRVVALAEKNGKRLSDLSPAELKSVHPGFKEDAASVFDLAKSLALRRTVGAPGTKAVAGQIRRWEKLLGL
jgi:argininosuccinate lyase